MANRSRGFTSDVNDPDRWMGSTIGFRSSGVMAISEAPEYEYHPSSQPPCEPPYHYPHSYGGCDSDDSPDVHAHLGTLGMLMGGIANDVVIPETAHIQTIRTYSDRLKAWHGNLPPNLTLTSALDDSPSSKNEALLVHCAYLGSIVLLTRRLHVERVAERSLSNHHHYAVGLNDVDQDAIEEFAKMCVDAAKQLATAVDLLRNEQRLILRCWQMINSSYTAAIVISLEVCYHRGRPMFESTFNESMSLIRKCISVLEYCSEYDTVADQYLKILQPIYTTLSRPIPTKRTIDSGTTNEELLDHILNLVRKPFGSVLSVPATLHTEDGYGFAIENAPHFPQPRHRQEPPHPRRPGGSEYPYRNTEEFEAFFRRAT